MRILLAVCGSISFYKAFEILSALKARGVSVRVALSPGALRFCSALAWQALADEVLAEDADWSRDAVKNHIAFSRGCDAVLLAPASANTINKLAAGIADNEFLATLLAAQDLPLIIAPAANARMLAGITAQNIAALQNRGALVVPPVKKRLACGEISEGALAEPEIIARTAINAAATSALRGKKILITAGATSEKIDSVRCISNFSSGNFGAAIAEAAYEMGAQVVLARANSAAKNFHNYSQISFSSSAELEQIICAHADADALIMAAAVSDFVPDAIAGKLPREGFNSELKITGRQNHDLLARASQKLKIAFKLEPNYSEQTVAKARAAMVKKGAALCVLNTLDEISFGSQESCIHLLSAQTQRKIAGPKAALAREILNELAKLAESGNNIESGNKDQISEQI